MLKEDRALLRTLVDQIISNPQDPQLWEIYLGFIPKNVMQQTVSIFPSLLEQEWASFIYYFVLRGFVHSKLNSFSHSGTYFMLKLSDRVVANAAYRWPNGAIQGCFELVRDFDLLGHAPGMIPHTERKSYASALTLALLEREFFGLRSGWLDNTDPRTGWPLDAGRMLGSRASAWATINGMNPEQAENRALRIFAGSKSAAGGEQDYLVRACRYRNSMYLIDEIRVPFSIFSFLSANGLLSVVDDTWEILNRGAE